MTRVVFLALALALTGCADMQRDPLAVYQGVTGVYEVPVVTFAVVPF